MEKKVILTDKQGPLLRITLNRPDTLNALSQSMLQELDEVFREVENDSTLRGVIMTGSGRAFAAGADIRELSAMDARQAAALSSFGQTLFTRIQHFSRPVIAAINGFALGGGCELAMACHLRIATEESKMGQPESTLGIIPGYGATQRLAQLVGRGRALEFMFTGDMISASEALAIGLVNKVVPKEHLMTEAAAIMDKILAKGPVAITRIIEAVNAGFGFEERGLESERAGFAACASTEDFKEGTEAFLSKRKPVFSGR